MRLFDTHTHLQFSEFDGDRDQVLERAWQAGLEGLLVLGTDVASSEAAIALAEAQPRVWAAAGCHPHDAKEMDDGAFRRLAELAHHPKVAAVGEIGLDSYRNLSPRDVQLRVFQRQLETAAELGKPVAVHCRQAHEAMFPILEGWSQRLRPTLPDGRPLGVLHYFSGDAALAECYVELGFLISIHCSVTYPKAERLCQVARRVSLAQLVVETDSPYRPPQSRRGQRPDGRPSGRSEPAYLVEAVRTVAELRGEPAAEVAEQTTANAFRLLGVPSLVAAQAGGRAE